jgi:hypothetical protein
VQEQVACHSPPWPSALGPHQNLKTAEGGSQHRERQLTRNDALKRAFAAFGFAPHLLAPAESLGAQWLSLEQALLATDEPAMQRLLAKARSWTVTLSSPAR